MTIDVTELRQWADGSDQDVVPLTKRAVRAIADEIERLRKIESHVTWRGRVDQVLREMHEARSQ
ncbi:hypothetical protein [Novosphingobium sp. FSW06-99]|uniref:hypothetical protein n=1 Tax=Novosphingobium sp. FSW06-99 TaxID=1739113 RepID=UPI00076CA193|nr:hypothetical protein [Novosphingobium sp. FSW06-99]KUR80772.1 hypothetical protein AQZ49_01725 [Novosphingobium sp. FSW06-99]